MVIHKFNIRYLVVTILPILLGLLFMHSSLNLELARAQSPETTPKLAVVGTDPEHSGSTIFMMDTDGENIVALTNDDFDNYSPVWSPDGTKLAFVTVDSFNLEDTRPSLAIIQMGTTLERTVIYHPTEQADNNTIVKLAWSPDSTMLVFFSQGVIHLVSADGSQNQIVTVADAEITSQNVFALGWTKDSKQLLIEYVPADHIVALQVNLDGSDPQEIPVQKNSVPIGENFSPDGNYAYNPSNPLSIFNYKDLINQPIDSVQAEENRSAPAAWSPDSTQIAIIGATDSGLGLFIVNADGTNAQQVDIGDIKIDLFAGVAWGFIPSDQVPQVEPTHTA